VLDERRRSDLGLMLMRLRLETRYAAEFCGLLRLRWMAAHDEKDSRDEPKEFWIHVRVYLSAMDMPQSQRNENRYFWRERGARSGKSTQGSIRFDSLRLAAGVRDSTAISELLETASFSR
jgi:hypothetical protein